MGLQVSHTLRPKTNLLKSILRNSQDLKKRLISKMIESEDSVIDEIIAVEKRWVQAHRKLDIDAIEEILAEDYMQIRSDGSVIDKEEALQSYHSGKRHWDFADSDEYRVVVHGETTILVGRWRGRGENNGERFDYAARFMAVYIRRDDMWHLLADQSTTLTE